MMENEAILIVDDSSAQRDMIEKKLKEEPYELLEASNGSECLQKIEEHDPDVVLLDYVMPGDDGLSVLEDIQAFGNPPMVIMQTARGSEEVAVAAMKNGAYDYIKKPCESEKLQTTVQHAIERQELEQETREYTEQLASYEDDDLIGESEEIKEIRRKIDQVAPTEASVVITGESGTGKELVARKIHQLSEREGPFLAVDCAALSDNLIQSELFGHEKGAFTGADSQREGKFERAEGGTILLDEIGEMSLDTQKHLLRVLEEEEVERLGGTEKIPTDVRVVCATNTDLKKAVEEGTFRKDLYYRIKVVHIHLPPVRERGDDRCLLAQHFLNHFREKYNCPDVTLSKHAIEALKKYEWPGNVRELRNVMERAVIISNKRELSGDDLPEVIQGNTELPVSPDQTKDFQEAKQEVVETFETNFIKAALKRNDGNITQSAEDIGMYRQNLHNKIKKLGIDVEQFR